MVWTYLILAFCNHKEFWHVKRIKIMAAGRAVVQGRKEVEEEGCFETLLVLLPKDKSNAIKCSHKLGAWLSTLSTLPNCTEFLAQRIHENLIMRYM